MPRIDTGAVELSYERSGSGPPLLLIMGMSGTFSHWSEPFLDELRESFETIVYDHRGVGESSPLSGELTTAQLAQDAAALLAALELDSAHVLGISMGGMVAQELALAHPERIRTLALGCTYCGGPGSSLASPEVMQRLAEGMSSGELRPVDSRMAAFALHCGACSSIFSRCTRPRLSFNQRSACSSMPRCTSASWIYSRAASSEGGSCPRA